MALNTRFIMSSKARHHLYGLCKQLKSGVFQDSLAGLAGLCFLFGTHSGFYWWRETGNCLPVRNMTHIKVGHSISPLMILLRLCAPPISMVTVSESSRFPLLNTLVLNLGCPPDQIKGHSENWQIIVLGMAVRVFPKRIDMWVSESREKDLPWRWVAWSSGLGHRWNQEVDEEKPVHMLCPTE